MWYTIPNHCGFDKISWTGDHHPVNKCYGIKQSQYVTWSQSRWYVSFCVQWVNKWRQSNTMQSATDPSASHDTDELPDSCIQLESQLLSASIRIEGLTDENQRLHNQIQILEDEIDNYRKTQQRLQHHVEKITATNDDLRCEISCQKGLRKFVKPVPTPEPIAQAKIDTANEGLGITKAKLVSMKETKCINLNISTVTDMCKTLGTDLT